MDEDRFLLCVAQSLADCQLVELQLKLYITEVFELIRKCSGNKIVFKMTGEDYADAPLSKLINVYSKLSDNEALLGDLRWLNKERNFLAHQAVISVQDHEGELSLPDLSGVEGRLVAIQSAAGRLREAIHEEANKFRPYLLFDDVCIR